MDRGFINGKMKNLAMKAGLLTACFMDKAHFTISRVCMRANLRKE
jgi:hypothetical protein